MESKEKKEEHDVYLCDGVGEDDWNRSSGRPQETKPSQHMKEHFERKETEELGRAGIELRFQHELERFLVLGSHCHISYVNKGRKYNVK